jgi:membrane protein DedA with SNARE-associated domain
MVQSGKREFLFKNLGKGLLWLAILVIAFIIFKKNVDIGSSEWLQALGDNAVAVYIVYVTSELMIGVIPPEMFMIWSLELTSGRDYVWDVTLLATLSYLAGVITYVFGRYFNQTVLYRYVRRRYLRRYEEIFFRYGGFLLFVAAVTPIPYSGICMLMGAVNFPARRFFTITIFRFVRFAVYGYIVYEASLI